MSGPPFVLIQLADGWGLHLRFRVGRLRGREFGVDCRISIVLIWVVL